VVIPRGYGWTKAMLGVKLIPLSKKPKKPTGVGSVKPAQAPQGEERRPRHTLQRSQIVEVAGPGDPGSPVRIERVKRGTLYLGDLRRLRREYRYEGMIRERGGDYEWAAREVDM